MHPLNKKIKDFICQRIEDRIWQEGDRIPSEAKLCKQFGVSRMTVNRAVRELTELGVLRRVQGSGTFVSPRTASAPLFEIQSIKAEIEMRGQKHSCRVLDLATCEVDEETAASTGLPLRHTLFYLEAVHHANATAIQLEKRFVNPRFAPQFIQQDFGQTTASDYLIAQVPYTDVEHSVSAIAADAEIAAALSIKAHTPCLRLSRRTLSGEDLITKVDLIHPGNLFKLDGRFPGNEITRRLAS